MLKASEDCAHNAKYKTLHNVRDELERVSKVVRATNFARNIAAIFSEATVEDTAARMKTITFVHLACHGIQDRDDALRSGFILGDGGLTVSGLMSRAAKLENAWFAYLSACQTATGDAEQPGQGVYLGAAMLFAGLQKRGRDNVVGGARAGSHMHSPHVCAGKSLIERALA
jgi:CHAT domain-containing protein